MRLVEQGRVVDKMGRIVLPKEARTAAGLFPNCDTDIYMDGSLIVISLANTVPLCARCGGTHDIYIMPDHKHLCESCCKIMLEQLLKP